MPLFCVTFKHHYLQHKLPQMGCTDVALRKHSTDGTRLGCDIFYEQWENPLRAIICFATHRHSRADSTAVSRIPSSGIHHCYWDIKWRASSVPYRQCSHKNIYPLFVSVGRYPMHLSSERKSRLSWVVCPTVFSRIEGISLFLLVVAPLNVCYKAETSGN